MDIFVLGPYSGEGQLDHVFAKFCLPFVNTALKYECITKIEVYSFIWSV